jgi:hypothetical protein
MPSSHTDTGNISFSTVSATSMRVDRECFAAFAKDSEATGCDIGRVRASSMSDGQASFRISAIIRAGLDEADHPLRLLAQPRGENATRCPTTHDDHVEALAHAAILFRATVQASG